MNITSRIVKPHNKWQIFNRQVRIYLPYSLTQSCIHRACSYGCLEDTFSSERRLSRKVQCPLAHIPIGKSSRSRRLHHPVHRDRPSFAEDNMYRCTAPRRPPSKDFPRNVARPRSPEGRRNSSVGKDLACTPRSRNRLTGSTGSELGSRTPKHPSRCGPDREAYPSDRHLVSIPVYVLLLSKGREIRKKVFKRIPMLSVFYIATLYRRVATADVREVLVDWK